MHPNSSILLLTTLENHLRQTKQAYYRAMPGVTYDDMFAAAKRVLEMRRVYEQASGRKPTTTITKRSISSLMRSI